MENESSLQHPEKIRQEFVKVLASRRKDAVPLEVRSFDAPPKPVVAADLPSIELSSEAHQLLEEERLLLLTEAGEQGQLPLLVIKPKSGNVTKRPTLIMLHSSYKCKDSIRPLLEHFAFRGYTVVAIDSRYHGHRASCDTAYQNAMISAWRTGEEMPFIFDTVWDVMKLMDYLVQREDVDAERIGITGISLGGMITLYSMAADARLAAAVPMIGVQNFRWAVENNRWRARVDSIPHCFEVAAQDLGKSRVDSETVAAVWQRIAPGLMHEFDVRHILRAAVPRALLILNGKEDPRCPVEGLEPCIKETAELYAKAGRADHFKFVAEENVGHWITKSMVEEALNWFDKFLMNKPVVIIWLFNRNQEPSSRFHFVVFMEAAIPASDVQQKAIEISQDSAGILVYSILFFCTLYVTAWLFIFREWPMPKRYRASSSCISFVHGLVASSLAMIDMASSAWKLDAANTPFQNKIMEWSMSYFIVDLVHYFVAVPEDHLFIAHHFATLSYMLSCRYYTGHGAKSAVSLIAAGEATTPLQAIWTLARLGRDEFPLADTIYIALSPVFTILFTIVRGMLGPFLLGKLAGFYLSGKADHVVPRWLACFWVLEVTFAVVGSMIWVYKLWRGLFRFYSQRGGIQSIWKKDD